MKYSTIISDLGNVICPFDYTRFYEKLSKDAGVAPEEIKRICWDPARYVDFEKGKMSPEVFLGRLQSHFKLRLPYEEIVESFCDIFTVHHDVVATWRQLKKTHQFCLLSNTNVLHIEYLKPKQDFWDIFDHLILSYEVGYVKPQEEIFQAAVKKCGADPASCVFVDDIDRYVEAARRAGLTAIQFQSPAQLRVDLAALGLV